MGRFQFVWCSGGSIVAITPPDLSYSCFFLLVLQHLMLVRVSVISRNYWNLRRSCRNKLLLKAISSPLHSVFQISINYRCLHVIVVAGGQITVEFLPVQRSARTVFAMATCLPICHSWYCIKWIKISSSFFLGLVAPPHRFSNTTHDCEILTAMAACHSGGLAWKCLTMAVLESKRPLTPQ